MLMNTYMEETREGKGREERCKEKRAFFVFIGVHHTYHDNLVQRLIRQNKKQSTCTKENMLSSLFSL